MDVAGDVKDSTVVHLTVTVMYYVMHVIHICLSSRSNGSLCQCGGERDSHASVTLSDYFSSAIVSHWESAKHSSEAPTDAFGEVEFAGASKRHSYVSTAPYSVGHLC